MAADPDAKATPPNGHAAGLTVDDLFRPANRRRQLRRTPRLTRDALRLVRQASPRHLLGLFGLQLLSGAGVAAQLLIARRILQELVAVSQGADANALWAPVALFTVVSVVLAALTALTAYQQRLLVELVGRHAFDRIVAVGSTVDYPLLETSEFYNQLERAKASGDYRISDMVTSVSQLSSALLATVGIAAVLLFLSPLLLALVALAAVPALIAATINSRESYAFEYAMTAESRERAYMLALLTTRGAAKEVRLFGLAGHLRRRYARLTDERLRQLRIFLAKRLRVTLMGGLASSAGMAIALGTLVLLLSHERIGVATALTAGLAMQQLAARLTTITAAVTRLIESGMFIDDYQAFVALPSAPGPDAAEPAFAPAPSRASHRNHVSVQNVSFSYPGAARPALQDVSLEVGPGEVVALVGGNGSGKTTLVKLICQLYRPATGRILWNGADAGTLAAAEVRADTTVLFQDYLQYHLPALDNIVFGRVENAARVEDAMMAARQAGAHDFLARLPDGYRTRMGLEFEGGHELSVGQWQRLALARAFFRGGGFLILDEPTAALDPRAERDLFAQIRALSEGRSVLLISHRFSSARSADRIYVLEEGRIIESGSHESLIARAGHYAELFKLQASAYLGEEASLDHVR